MRQWWTARSLSRRQRWSEKKPIKTYLIYWRLYGGAKAFFKSAYLYVAIFVTFCLHPLWFGEAEEKGWPQIAIDVIPSMLGFSMGGMAIMLAFSSRRIFSAISQKGKPDSFFMKVIANFFHFILIQTLAILGALLSKAYGTWLISGTSFFLFVYALLVGLATAGQLLRTAQIFNAAGSLSDNE